MQTKHGAKETLIGKMIEIVALRKDGTEFPVELSLSSWKNKEGQTYFTGIIRDITEKKLALENLTLSEERLSQIIEVSKDWIWEVNTKGLYTYTSGIVEEMLGYKSNEIVNNKYFYDFFPEEKREKLKKIIFEAFKQKKIFHNFINSSISKSGGIVWFSMSGIPILDNKGDLIGYRGANCDITKCVNSEKALLEAKEKVEESANLKREFIQNLSHEIRTPMNGILGFSELLNDSDLTKEKQSEYVEIIQNSSTQLLHVIDDLLEISILDTNQLKKQEGKVNLNKLLEELFSVFQLKNKNNKVSFCIKKGLPNKQSILLTDKKILKKVLGILIENAFKFTQKGFVELGYQLRGDKIELYVKDSGIGINKENYDLIFELFSQEEKELSQKVGGLGLGLSIAKKSIQLLGGDIRVASEKGKGATFFVTVKRT